MLDKNIVDGYVKGTETGGLVSFERTGNVIAISHDLMEQSDPKYLKMIHKKIFLGPYLYQYCFKEPDYIVAKYIRDLVVKYY